MTSQHSGLDRNDHAISTLRTLWYDGHSTSEISRRMGIVGKVHRLRLPARLSPIGKRPGPKTLRPPQSSRRQSHGRSVLEPAQ